MLFREAYAEWKEPGGGYKYRLQVGEPGASCHEGDTQGHMARVDGNGESLRDRWLCVACVWQAGGWCGRTWHVAHMGSYANVMQLTQRLWICLRIHVWCTGGYPAAALLAVHIPTAVLAAAVAAGKQGVGAIGYSYFPKCGTRQRHAQCTQVATLA